MVSMVESAEKSNRCGGNAWPFISIRHPMSVNERADEFPLLAEAHRRHPGACDEFWFATGSRKTIPDLEREVATFARYRGLCDGAGIGLGYQQGMTLGHGEKHDGKGRPGEQVFSDDAWQRGRDGGRIPFLCPRSPEVLAYEREYAKAVMRVARPTSFWIDDDLRLGVCKPEGCFCGRCLAAFNEFSGGGWTREALVARLFDAESAHEPVRVQWSAFNAGSLAAYAAEVRKAADETGLDCRLGYQAVWADRTYTADGYGPVLAALSGAGGAMVGIRPGAGFYNEGEPRCMVRKCLSVAREAERVSGAGPVGGVAVCYEEETYPRHMLHKTPGAIVKECALALASGCDSLSIYWFPAESPLPVEEYDRFLGTLVRARPYFTRLAESTRRTRLGGVARYVGSAAGETPDFDLYDETDFDLACAGIPVTVANPAVSAWYATDKTRREMAASDGAALAALPVADIGGMGRFPTAARRAKLLDDLDSLTGGAFPVRVDACRALRILPRVLPGGRLDSVTLLNLSIGDTGPLSVRLRNPAGGVASWQGPGDAAPLPVSARGGGGEMSVALDNLGPWEIGTLFIAR